MNFSEDMNSESMVILMKILGALTAVFTFRWVYKIFAGTDKKLTVDEFLKMIGFWFFLFAGAYMIYKEGERKDLINHVYGELYLALIFGPLLVVLHLDNAIDKIGAIMQKIAELRRGTTVTNTNTQTEEVKVAVKKEEVTTQVP